MRGYETVFRAHAAKQSAVILSGAVIGKDKTLIQ
jgi:hypothetical protein